MKEAVSNLLVELCEKENVIVLDMDCMTSTGTVKVKNANPSRFVNVGICEQNGIGVAAGLAASGFTPIVNGFAAMLVFRAAEQIVHAVSYPKSNIKIIGHYSGLSGAQEGAAHHCLTDLAFMLSLPNFSIYTPHNAPSAVAAVLQATSIPGPAYIRLFKGDDTHDPYPYVCRDGFDSIGKADADTQILFSGRIGEEINSALKEIDSKGESVCLNAVWRLKPFPLGLKEQLFNAQRLLVIEEHGAWGGLYTLLLHIFADAGKKLPSIKSINCGSKHYSSGTLRELRNEANLTESSVLNALSELLE